MGGREGGRDPSEARGNQLVVHVSKYCKMCLHIMRNYGSYIYVRRGNRI